ncbi:pyridoxamine 5'-phosphate oxidase family protein [Lachnospiraceae bacterium MD1]|uniref:Pyridoxamine 5'-phosphate oxidase family protein n=1 Tax=Variimorphobacter saccharofermentans TaxID=2755051 RepID=A0A839JZR1_9FIRM|nr:pyridoxamine 5'-phosphate oxidase family protein [Variimorphobacter saccharofermentans]MBB2182677.1 pyridoxamine 5'-phosphate oxidase family protein [Variimorphobacter saccharofermentans]
MALTKNQIEEYLKSTKKILLSTVTEENKPDLRILGAIATDGANTYFSTLSNARKVTQIELNPNVAVYFEAPDQKFPNYINATVYGKARKVVCEKELEKAVALIKDNLPHFEWSDDKSIYVVEPDQIKFFNSSAELAQDKVQIVEYNNKES